MRRRRRICGLTEGAGECIIPAWRNNQLMKRGVRWERDHFSTGGRQSSNHQNVEMSGTDALVTRIVKMQTTENTNCFVIMPFTLRTEDKEKYFGDENHWHEVYDGLIKPALRKAGMTCNRDDDDARSRSIADKIWEKIEKADLVLCDISNFNPNVFLLDSSTFMQPFPVQEYRRSHSGPS
jgi:hypothetical protein